MDKFDIINKELFHAGGVDWTPSVAPKVGDVIAIQWARPQWRIWLDRFRLMRWDVPTMEPKMFTCTGTTPGAIWPESKSAFGQTLPKPP